MNSTIPRIVAINGSPRHENGNTQIMLSAFLEGAHQMGANVETIHLAHHKITPCCGELICWQSRERRCVHRDDMSILCSKLKDIDYLILAFPLYFDAMPSMLQKFMERLLPLGAPFLEKDENGDYRHGDLEGVTESYQNPGRIIMLCNAGFPEQNNFGVVSLWGQRIARNMHTEVVAEIYRGMSAVLQVPAQELAPVVSEYRAKLKQACIETIQDSRISSNLQAELNRELIPKDVYAEHVNLAAMSNWEV